MTTAIGNAPESSDMVYAHNDLAGFVMQVACWLVTALVMTSSIRGCMSELIILKT